MIDYYILDITNYIATMSAEVFEKANLKYDIVKFAKLCLTDGRVSKFFYSGIRDISWCCANRVLSEIEWTLGDKLQKSNDGYCCNPPDVYWAGYLYGYWSRMYKDSPEDIWKYAPMERLLCVAPAYHTLDINLAIRILKEDYFMIKRKNKELRKERQEVTTSVFTQKRS